MVYTRMVYERSGRAPIEADVALLPMEDPDLWRVFVEGEDIGSIRREDKGWMALGAFVIDPVGDAVDKEVPRDAAGLPCPDLFNLYWESRDKAVEALVTTWVDALQGVLYRLKFRRHLRIYYVA